MVGLHGSLYFGKPFSNPVNLSKIKKYKYEKNVNCKNYDCDMENKNASR